MGTVGIPGLPLEMPDRLDLSWWFTGAADGYDDADLAQAWMEQTAADVAADIDMQEASRPPNGRRCRNRCLHCRRRSPVGGVHTPPRGRRGGIGTGAAGPHPSCRPATPAQLANLERSYADMSAPQSARDPLAPGRSARRFSAGRPGKVYPVDPILQELRVRRVEQGYSIAALAALLHVAKGTLRDWEMGVRHPKQDSVRAWAQALGYQPELLPIVDALPADTFRAQIDAVCGGYATPDGLSRPVQKAAAEVLLSLGWGPRDVARRTGLSRRTVERYREDAASQDKAA